MQASREAEPQRRFLGALMSDVWKLPWKGGCLCGGVRLQITAPPLLTLACHCAWCRKRSGSAFSSVISLPSQGFAITSGEPEPGWAPGDNPHYFCSRCKNWLFLRIPSSDSVNLRAGTLDDDRWFAPYVEIFAENKSPWVSTLARHSFASLPAPEDWAILLQSFAGDGPRPK
jgi:hypothetical protein